MRARSISLDQRGTKLNSHFFWSRDIMKSHAQYKTSLISKSQLNGR